jgi:hypothetical protein
MKTTLTPKTGSTRTDTIADRPPEMFVTYLNQQSAAIQSIEFDNVSVSAASGSLIQQAVSLDGDLYCAKPRQFRLRAGLKLSPGIVDIGSNPQYFWMHVKGAQEPNYVYCSHADYASGKATLPIPFDTEWVLQALGMTTYDPAAAYKVEVRQREREYALISEGQTPQGVKVRKITVFAADHDSKTAPVVKKHVIQDARGNLIATAEILKVKPVNGATDPATGQPTVVLVPMDVTLTFQGADRQQMKLSMKLDKETVNPPMDEKKQQYLYTLPNLGTHPVNLADYRFTPTARGQAPGRRWE